MSTAQGVARALASSAPPLNFINAALVGAAGAVQIATIEGASYHRGRDPRMAADEQGATIQRDEAVLDTGVTRQIRDALRQGQGGGGSPSFTFMMGTKTVQEGIGRAARQPGAVRSTILGKSKPWRNR